MEWTDEQIAILGHADGHGRIEAGPGTGKSTTLIELAGRLARSRGQGAVRLATFTRAATSDLAHRALAEEVPVPVTTVHSLALRILIHNSQWTRLPLPIRIPDEWELDVLIHEDLRTRLGVSRKSVVERLEREMAAQWESLDDTLLIGDFAPQLRDAYVATWLAQRRVFGYSLFAEMPWYALELTSDHPEADTLGIEFLMVDEFQDLNKCEIGLVKSLADRGMSIVAVGDEDQSIYSWRMAAPEGIRNFPAEFAPSSGYALSVSQRCGRRILAAAQRVISIAPGRPANRPRLRPSEGNPDGTFEYLRFSTAQDERKAAIDLLTYHSVVDGIPYDRMCILTRSDYQRRWSRPLREALERAAVPYTDVEAALEPLHTEAARQLLALARLALSRADDLAWWTILKLCPNVSDQFIASLADVASENGRRFSDQIARIGVDPVPGGSAVSLNAARHRVRQLNEILDRLVAPSLLRPPEWLGWIRDAANALRVEVSDDLLRLFEAAVPTLPEGSGLSDLLAQLEPMARDAALEAGGVSIMTCSKSKGLTFDVVVVAGVENELFPLPASDTPEEERRLLYVAMTRARVATYLTMAMYRRDGTSRSGGGSSVVSRTRCEFLSQAGIRPVWGPDYVQAARSVG